MKVTVEKSGITAKDEFGKVHKINGIELKVPGKPSRFYDKDDHFFKTACPSGTTHLATLQADGNINLH